MKLLEPIRVTSGYTPAERWRGHLADGRRVFVKRAVDHLTAEWLRTEIALYRALAGAPFLAEVVHTDDGAVPELWLEDLAHGHWPGPWRPGDAARVLAALDAVHDTVPPPFVGPVAGYPGWAEIGASPDAFLGLGWVTEAWLAAALPVLVAAERSAPRGPPVLLHQDVRSDNLCLLPDRVVLVDWNWVSCGPRDLDRALWAASLEAEGGPRPEEIVTSMSWAATISGFFGWRAGQPPIPEAPRVRWIQRIQLATALPWAIRTYGLAPPDGPRWASRDRIPVAGPAGRR